MDNRIKGFGTALVTPFRKGGDGFHGNEVDFNGLTHLVEMQIMGGVDFLVPCGTTGESPTLSMKEHAQVIEHVMKISNGRVPVVPGTGSNNTAEAYALTKEAKMLGLEACMVVAPYYNKPMTAGFLEYYMRLAEIGIPVIMYDIPSRTGKGVPLEAILNLMGRGAITGIKWASGNLSQLTDIHMQSKDGFKIFSGDDEMTLPAMSLGAAGVISVLGNISPRIIRNMLDSIALGNWEDARNHHHYNALLMRAMFRETNPIPVKTALHLIYPDLFEAEFRSPISRMGNENARRLHGVLRAMRLVVGEYHEIAR